VLAPGSSTKGDADKKNSKHTEQQIAFALRQAYRGAPVADFLPTDGVSEASSYV